MASHGGKISPDFLQRVPLDLCRMTRASVPYIGESYNILSQRHMSISVFSPDRSFLSSHGRISLD